MWDCQCDCGNKVTVGGDALKSGASQSCGCYGKEQRLKSSYKHLDDQTGLRFGRLIVLGQADSRKTPKGQTKTYWTCQCDCGNKIEASSTSLKTGTTQSCGCYKSDVMKATPRNKDITGFRFGSLTAIERVPLPPNSPKSTYAFWKCRCDCGAEVIVSYKNLERLSSTSCGCQAYSNGEKLTARKLAENNFEYSKEYSFPDLRTEKGNRQRFDFAVFNKDHRLMALIEYQGAQHYNEIASNLEYGKQQREVTDLQKLEYCKTHNIPLIAINSLQNVESQLDDMISQLTALYDDTVPSESTDSKV